MDTKLNPPTIPQYRVIHPSAALAATRALTDRVIPSSHGKRSLVSDSYERLRGQRLSQAKEAQHIFSSEDPQNLQGEPRQVTIPEDSFPQRPAGNKANVPPLDRLTDSSTSLQVDRSDDQVYDSKYAEERNEAPTLESLDEPKPSFIRIQQSARSRVKESVLSPLATTLKDGPNGASYKCMSIRASSLSIKPSPHLSVLDPSDSKVTTSSSMDSGKELTDPNMAGLSKRKQLGQVHIACDQCRQKKIRCNKGDPCETCVKRRVSCTRRVVRNKNKGRKRGQPPVPEVHRPQEAASEGPCTQAVELSNLSSKVRSHSAPRKVQALRPSILSASVDRDTASVISIESEDSMDFETDTLVDQSEGGAKSVTGPNSETSATTRRSP